MADFRAKPHLLRRCTEFDVEYVMTLVHLDGRVDPRPHFLGRAPPGWSDLDSSNLKIESPFSGEKKN